MIVGRQPAGGDHQRTYQSQFGVAVLGGPDQDFECMVPQYAVRPATSNALHTSVGASAILRFLRPVAFQDFPDHALPIELWDANDCQLPRRVDGAWPLA